MTEATPAAPAATAPVPGKTLGIVALILAFFFQLLGLILGIVAKSQSKAAGVKNTPATVAIVLSIVLMVVGIGVGIAVGVGLGAACNGLEPGTYTLENGATLTCGG